VTRALFVASQGLFIASWHQRHQI